MGQKHLFSIRKNLARRMMFAALATLILTGCGCSVLGGGKAEANSVLWKHRDQFVRIEEQGPGQGPVQPNDHPVQLPADQIHTMLGALSAQFKAEEKPVPLFIEQELKILADAISTGLETARPSEDVTFHIIGIHREFISFTSDRQFISGRVFYRDGKLNLLIGRLHEPYRANFDRRLYPVETGTRQYTELDPRRPAPRSWKPVPMAGLETPTVEGIKRDDWLVLTPDPKLWKTALAEKKEAKETAKDAFREASEVRESSVQLEAEQQKLKTEIQEMKQTIEEMKQAPATAAPAAAPTTAPAAAAPTGLKKIEERLQILQNLKSKGLITEEEFRSKKLEILDSI
jgi:hypothetical protein